MSKAIELNQDNEVLRWHLSYLLSEQDWLSIINLISQSPPLLTAGNEYQYWLARAYEQTGNDSLAQQLYSQLAEHRHYYGFLASARLGRAINLENQPIVVSADTIANLLRRPEIMRAYELFQLERYYEARREWRHLQGKLRESEQLAMVELATAWGWHDRSIFALSDMGMLNDVDKRFPLAYVELLSSEAHKYNVEPEWALAIARRESSFMPDAVSPANARGLMQVLPSTARYLEKRRMSSRQLLNPKLNAKLGNKYLRYLLDKLDNNVVLATASYNAGWRRVKQWVPQSGTVPADIWVETIPYKETRNYVKAVMAYKQIYQTKLADKSASSNPSVFAEFSQLQIGEQT